MESKYFNLKNLVLLFICFFYCFFVYGGLKFRCSYILSDFCFVYVGSLFLICGNDK